MTDKIVTRFAPSPTGYLHRGHALSALTAYEFSVQNKGQFLLRIEDIDTVRCREDYIQPIYDDLAWLGLTWPVPVRRQSQHFNDYQQALDQLTSMGVTYPCDCTRKDIQALNPERGPEGLLYPGSCKGQSARVLKQGNPHVIRLDLTAATDLLRSMGCYPATWGDSKHGIQETKPDLLGDVVLQRKDTPTSYHLSVVVDDGLQGVTDIVRGYDLFHATHIHVILQALLGLPQPRYHHHALMLDHDGQKFSKSNKSETLQSIRATNIARDDFVAGLPRMSE